ncbi:unnamed protein product [marine sediment metagenome]|uniref:Aldehyde dehydrogenase domain-containing protein n=1 Tax=marine sediment metagenome TaxID=412755 RepID=X1C978_9ZZZZ
MSLKEDILEIARQAKSSSQRLANLSSKIKDEVLSRMAEIIETNARRIKEENFKDVASAREKGLSGALIDRLTLNDKRIRQMADSLRQMARLEDPIGKVDKMSRRPNGLLIGKVIVPLGVIGIIYEARPNVTVDAAALCLKAGNATILRGGSEAIAFSIDPLP